VPVSIYHLRYARLRKRLIAMRKAAGLTQVQLATRLGIGQSFVSKVERGVTYVELFLFLDWCQACGVVPDTQWSDLGAESGSSYWPPTDG
jgi:transcriptional regulator with XRE-family HTH domain